MKRKYLRHLIFLLFAIMLFLLERGGMFKGGIDDNDSIIGLNYIIVLMLGMSLIEVLQNRKSLLHNKITKRFVFSNLYVYTITVLWSMVYVIPSRDIFGYALLPVMMFLYMTIVTQFEEKDGFILGVISVVAIAVAFYFISVYFASSIEIKNRSNSSYTILYLLPFMLCLSNRVARIVAIILTLVLILFSLKLGGFFAAVVGVTVYLFLAQFVKRNKRIGIMRLLLFFIGMLGIYLLIIRINGMYLDDLLTVRLLDAQDTGGSGRSDIFSDIFHLIGESSIISVILGHGWGGTSRDTYMGLTAHNDFLEVFYDFGVISFILYVLLIIELFNLCRRLIKMRSNYAPAMGASLAIFLVGSMFSHIWIYYHNLLLFAMFWGFICAREKVKKVL